MTETEGKLVSGLGAAIGCRLLKMRNQLVFVEYSKGAIALLDLIRPLDSVVSQGSIVLKGTWLFDCETGLLGGALGGPGDIWWEQIDPVKRQMKPIAGASLVNLGKVNFALITPALLQLFTYGKTPIPGNNDPTNQLVNDDVFAVRTNAGNVAKIRVVQYGYDMKIEWATYKLDNSYHVIGTGYATPEDIVVTSDEKIAYVTERTGNLLRVDLKNANRAAAVVVASGMQAPHQIHLDEARQQAYVVEYANPGRLVRIDLKTGQQKVLISNLSNAIGLLVSRDLAYAYISEQSGGGRITRYSLHGAKPVAIASGLTNPFFLTWADPGQTSIFVAERDPANCIAIVETIPYPGSVRRVVTGVGGRPSSVALIDATHMLICCDQEIDLRDVLAGIIPSSGLFIGIGLVPWNLITAEGKADTTSQTTYPYQFPKNSPFGGSLTLQINYLLAKQMGVNYYRIKVNGNIRFDAWWDLKLNLANGRYEIPIPFKPVDANGLYAIHEPLDFFVNTNLGMILDSTSLPNGKLNILVEFFDVGKNLLSSHLQPVLIDNNQCTATIEMPTINGIYATTECGMIKFSSKTQKVTIQYVASHPNRYASYSWQLGRAGKGPVSGCAECSIDGPVSLAPFTLQKDVASLLGTCPSAAFYAWVYVATQTINGYGRQSQYDASAIISFALTP